MNFPRSAAREISPASTAGTRTGREVVPGSVESLTGRLGPIRRPGPVPDLGCGFEPGAAR
jgi:hypothetical protein